MSPKSPQLLSFSLFLATAGVYVVLALRYPIAYIWATYEDLFGEWIQFWFFVVTLVLSARVAVAKSRYRWFFVALACACLYVAMEEISWGQRLLGVSTPEFFKEHNLQGEINLHNFLTGPYSTLLKDAIAYFLAAALAGYGLVYPLGIRRRFRPALFLDRWGVAAPPLHLWPFFVTAAVLELGPLSFNEAEVAELLVGFALTIMSVQYALAVPRELSALQTATWPGETSRRLTGRIVWATILVLNLSALTTLSIYATPTGRSRIERRIENGVEKFAGRYARRERWDTAVRLYGLMHESNPRSCSTMRKLAGCYEQMGDTEQFSGMLGKALKVDLARYAEDPRAASVNRSLVRTYRMLGDNESAQKYLANALTVGLERLERHPTSANAAYSLGRTYELTDNHADALMQFERATELRPTSKKYRKAYYRARKKLQSADTPDT